MHPLSPCPELAQRCWDETGACRSSLYPFWSRDLVAMDSLPPGCGLRQGLSRSAAAAMELLGHAFAGIVVSYRFSAYNHLPLEQRQLCWAHLIRDLAAIADRPGASGEIGMELLDLQQQLFDQWHQWKDGRIDWPQLQQSCLPIRRTFEATLQRVVDLGCERGEQTPWAQTVRTCRQLLQRR